MVNFVKKKLQNSSWVGFKIQAALPDRKSSNSTPATMTMAAYISFYGQGTAAGGTATNQTKPSQSEKPVYQHENEADDNRVAAAKEESQR